MEVAGRRQFQVDSCLGRGGFGEVYRARMSSAGGLEADVALKVLRRDIDPRGQAVQRLRDEGRLLARLNHPTILRVHDLVVLDGRISLITEFVDGEDLAILFKADPRPSPRALIEAIGQVAGALDMAWNAPLDDGTALRLVHRDIKPSNIRVSRHGEVKLLDFGIARADSVEREARTQTDLMVGSPAYMAPERFLDTTTRPASDVFSLGATLYEGLTGKRFYNDMPVPMLAAVAINGGRYAEFLEKQLAPLSQLPEPVLRLLRDTLAYDPDTRPTAADLAGRCEALSDDLAGVPLSRYCREHGWDTATPGSGELDGRILTEGTIARERGVERLPAPIVPRGSDAARKRLPLYVGMGASVAGLTIAIVMIGFASGIGLGLRAFPGEAEVPAAVVPAPVVSPAPVPVKSEPEPEPIEPEPIEPEPVRPEPVVAPKPVAPKPVAPKPVAPKPVAPKPVEVQAPPVVEPSPVEAPAVAAVVSGRVTSSGDAQYVQLSAGPKRFAVPGDVPPGRYDVLATFNGNEVRAGSLEVRAGGEHHLACAARMFRCEIR